LASGGHFEVTTTATGEELLDRYGKARFDLVVLDVLMPGMDGPTTLARLRKLPAGADVPVVFLSGRDEPSEVARLKSLGALAVLAKPFDPGLLAGTLAEILEHHKSARNPAAPGARPGAERRPR
jgi:CheY-like chemotaxis protein